ncbi:hypothetical protein SAMN05216223_107210 [Actinacidiphila yanglinensis]|uniref:Lipoprotein n=1 Tax=Actinacidiphila yanglinensis TaxID=310779 RepID=A0A1H6BTM4_9ACTN|nr:hypothetical protein [Actinacidiphila yanglinensis]SEG64013.1 hypothetical protein SAMN05216223_107210 [Actinacidiphila yanglinensis]
MRTTTAACCALAAAALLATTACGGPTHHARTANPAANKATPTPSTTKGADPAASRAVAAMVARVAAKSSSRLVEIQHRTSGTVTMSGWQVWGSSGAALDFTVSPADLGMQNLNHSSHMEMRTMDGSEYLSIDPVKSGAFKGKRWLRYSMAAVGGSGLTGAMDKAGRQSPIEALRAPAADGEVALVGRETMDGKPTTHYRATVAADSDIVALEDVPVTAQADVWVGPDGYPVRYVWDDGKQRNITDFQSFGGARTIRTPPASDVIDTSNKAAASSAPPAG